MLVLGKQPAGYPGFSRDGDSRYRRRRRPDADLVDRRDHRGVPLAAQFFFERTILGKALRAAASDREAAAIVGIDVGRTVMLSFVIAAFAGALAGVIVTPLTLASYDQGAMIGFKGFSAAMLGGIGSLPGAVVGGLALGLIEAFGSLLSVFEFQGRHRIRHSADDPVRPPLRDPRTSRCRQGLMKCGFLPQIAPSSARGAPAHMAASVTAKAHGGRRGGVAAALSPYGSRLLLVPLVAPNAYVVSLGNLFLINVILIASLNLLMGYGGQISLGHAGFFGLGAYASGVLSAKFAVSAVDRPAGGGRVLSRFGRASSACRRFDCVGSICRWPRWVVTPSLSFFSTDLSD